MKSRVLIVLSLIVLLGAVLRFIVLDQVPPSLNWDEVSHGYNAYSILKTGKDEWGQRFPRTSFRAFGDYKLPLYIYLTAPLTVFGLNEWTIRAVSALSGIGAIIFTFLLVQKLFNNPMLSALSSLLLAVSPWHFILSRAAFEANLALFLVILATFLFLLGLKKEKFLPVAAIFYGLSLYSYNSAKIFVPLLIITFVLLYRKEIFAKMRFSALALIIFLLMFLPHLILLPSQEGQARFYWSTILDPGAIAQINKARSVSNLPQPLPRFVHNKGTYFLSHFFSNWLSHYSPQFLFFQGSSHYQYSIPGRGVMPLLEAPFLLIGFVALLFWRKKGVFLILIWFFLGPIAAAVTRDSPNVLRSILILPSLQVISAFGVLTIGKFPQKFGRQYYLGFLTVFLFLLLMSAFGFFTDYFGKYRKDYSFAWQYGYKQVANFVKKNYDNYDQIIMTKKYGEPHEFLLFYLGWPPEKYQSDPNLIRFYRSNWYWVDRFDKFYFVNDWQIPKEENGEWKLESGGVIPTEGKTLLVTSPENHPPNWYYLETVNFLDGKPAFEIYTSS